MKYADLAKINVNEHIEKKNGLSYLSWAWAADQLLRNDPAATWTYAEPVRFGDTLMVFCTVTAFGKAMTAQLPVMDHRNKAIPNPDAFSVNTAMQRALAKAIALHGIGLYIYAGEDIPEADTRPASAKSVTKATFDDQDADTQKWLVGIADSVRIELEQNGAAAAVALLEEQGLEDDHKVALWALFDSKERAAMKAVATKRAA